VRARGRREESKTAGLAPGEAERLREIIRVVQESGIGEVTIEEGEMRVTVRRTDDRPDIAGEPSPVPTAPVHEEPEGATQPPQNDIVRVESPMVGTFYRAPQPGAAPFVEEGDTVEAGQTLCILEAMKLMNEVKAESEGIVRRVCVDNAAPVQYGDLLFELEPLNGRPLDAL
jgi:oxaloacetate decarboxylase alpha subunit